MLLSSMVGILTQSVADFFNFMGYEFGSFVNTSAFVIFQITFEKCHLVLTLSKRQQKLGVDFS